MSAKNFLKPRQKEQLQKALRESNSPDFTERVLILLLKNDGKTYPEITDFLGCSYQTVAYWCLHGDPSNLESLRNQPDPGKFRQATQENILREPEIFRQATQENIPQEPENVRPATQENIPRKFFFPKTTQENILREPENLPKATQDIIPRRAWNFRQATQGNIPLLNVKVLEDTFARVRPHHEKFAASFYHNLFTDCPQLRVLFKNTSMEDQEKKLIMSLVLVINNLRHLAYLKTLLKDLGERHVKYGARPEFYPLVGAALLKTFASYLGTDWTPEVKQAWTDGYEAVVNMMLAKD